MDGNGVFTIDGVDLRVMVTGLKRSFAVTDSEHSGRLQNYEMFRDVIGTFYNYTLNVEPDPDYRADYDTFYGIISAPTPFHDVVFPYGQETLAFKAYVTSGDDDYKGEKRYAIYGIPDSPVIQTNKYSGLSVQFIAKSPQRRP